ncbi:MAG: glycosyltransferase N-terminal domain-containing protein [Hydrogenovibrio sp.]|nr:glycosyltransferase N-terminal domain-containing protein [Hydrogenovibrio sp.]
MIYQLLIRLLSPVILILILLEATRRKGGWRFFAQRFGWGYDKNATPSSIWIHCASVGEVKAAEKLIEALLPEHSILVTTNTPTGASLVRNLFGDKVRHAYCPLDWPSVIQRFLKVYRPNALWVMETEIWPNLYRACYRNNIPVSLLNARLSQKTLNSPSWLKTIYRQTLEGITRVLTRNQAEADRFRLMGVPANKIHILGNLKYAGLNALPSYPDLIGRPYILAASTHDSEELAIVRGWLQMNRPELLVIVPRHPKRTPKLLKTLAFAREEMVVFSAGEKINQQTRIYLDDQIGVLMPLFAHAKLVIMGGAFAPKGGHNVLEPASQKAAILTGPDMSDFEEETELLKTANGLVQVDTYDELFKRLEALLDDETQRKTMGDAAYRLVCSQHHILDDYQTTLAPDLSHS